MAEPDLSAGTLFVTYLTGGTITEPTSRPYAEEDRMMAERLSGA